jgi:hypothetical protein
MKKLSCLLLILALTVPAFAEIKVTGTAPTVTGTGADLFNKATEEAFKNAIDDLNDKLKVFKGPDSLLEAMGNSSVYASHGATTRGYGGYKIFTATIGPMVGFQLPKDIASLMDDMDGLSDSLDKDGDVKFGISPNVLNANVGLSLGVFKFLPEHLGVLKRDNLYLGLRIGYFNLQDFIEDFDYSSFTFGLTVNYQIIPSVSLAGLIAWRGVSLGSGLLYNHSKTSISMAVTDTEPQDIVGYDSKLAFKDPRVSINLTTNTFTIPLEAVTAIKLVIFNIHFGLGADLAFGATTFGAGITTATEYENLPDNFQKDKEGQVTANGELSILPSFFNFKIMTGLGITAGPVVFDIPITYYPASGYSIGLTIGAVF